MVNTEDFIKRLEHLLDYYALTASSFADKIRVQRSSISHLLSGRNKPSLDFIMKIIDVFPEVNLYWMLDGKGSFLKNEGIVPEPKPILAEAEITPPPALSDNKPQPELFDASFQESEIPVVEEPKKTSPTVAPLAEDFLPSNKSDVYKIVIFYKDGTFLDFKPQK